MALTVYPAPRSHPRDVRNAVPEEMLYRLRTVQRHSFRLANGKELEGLSCITPEQRAMFEAAGVPLPTLQRLHDAP